MGYYEYNPQAQRASSPMTREPYLKNVPQNKLFTLKEGTYRIRILPPWSSSGLYARFTQIHWEAGLSKTTFICPNMVRENTCPFCALYSNLRAEYDKYEPDISVCRPAKRWYANIIDLNNPGAGVLVYSFGKIIYTAIQNIQDSGEYGDITHPAHGTDMTLTRTGQGRNSKDAIYPARQSTPIQNPQWLDQLFNLDDIFLYPNPADVESAFASQPWKVYRPAGYVSTPQPVSNAPVAVGPGPVITAPIPGPQPAPSAPAAAPVAPQAATSAPVAPAAPIPTPQPVQPPAAVQPAPVQVDSNVADRYAQVDALEAALKAKLQK